MYHAGKNNVPLCGTRGTGGRYNVLVVDAKTWNSLSINQRCSKCVSILQKQASKDKH